ncbi:hypothetical protein FA15DRAFT_674944 [Coprinopsis marcescibilis]|uniref:BTB domain-containing protein n=1 Tax=Coprinopsis marcescibilis TaxID=230819 RepID=A0A5C3KFM0_COPMA|nr:hypothetical protein FA15DRAFT_674944 [Coprinopsis marcescibilis]
MVQQAHKHELVEVNGSCVDKTRSTYWFEDATLSLHIEDTRFRIHYSLISRHSPLFRMLATSEGEQTVVLVVVEGSGVIAGDHLSLTVKEPVLASDLDALLGHIYDQDQLMETSGFPRVASILRVSSRKQLDFPEIHAASRCRMEELIPAKPLMLNPETHPLYEALEIANRYEFPQIRKAILYMLVTIHHFEYEEMNSDHSVGTSSAPDTQPDETAAPPAISPSSDDSSLSSRDRKICADLLNRLISHFTPTLYTPATGSHMGCTDRFADMWMPCVIQPSFEDDGVYKPLETLEKIKGINWVKEGICEACAEEKRQEWTEEQDKVWVKLDEWIPSTGGLVT